MTPTAITPRSLVARLGGHPTEALGIDLSAPGGVERWLVAVCLGGGRIREQVAAAAHRGLCEAGMDTPARIQEAEVASVENVLRSQGHPESEYGMGVRAVDRHGHARRRSERRVAEDRGLAPLRATAFAASSFVVIPPRPKALDEPWAARSISGVISSMTS